MTPIDAIDLEIVKASLGGIVQEMQNSLFRTGFSTIVRESQDASCALMNANGEVVAQHVVLPLHIGAFPACCAAVRNAFAGTIEEGDAFLINHPYDGGSPHSPDIAVIAPVFIGGALFGFAGSIAHKSDIGGPVAGSCSSQAREIFNEGLQIPAVRYASRHVTNRDIERIIAANSRTPDLVLGDIRGQLGADRLGAARLVELARRHGAAKVLAAYDRLFEIARLRLALAIRSWPDGRFEAERFVDDDGIDLERPVRIHVAVEKSGDAIRFDFSGSADQTSGPANVRPPLVQAACAYCLISLIDPGMYVCSGLLQGFSVVAREGSVLNPRFPAPVNTYNPTVHALVDAICAALAAVAPARARADGSGSRSIILGGRNARAARAYVQYEIVAGGAGARAVKDGASGITVNQSNARIAPIEIIETEFPTRVLRFDLIGDSGGAGRWRGGLGLRREYLNLADARFSILDEACGSSDGMRRRRRRPGRRHCDQSGHANAEAAARALCRLPAQARRRVPSRHAGRRRLWRSAGPRARERARRYTRGLCQPGGGRAGLRGRAGGDGRRFDDRSGRDRAPARRHQGNACGRLTEGLVVKH
jgi:N-methylhydantoinase B